MKGQLQNMNKKNVRYTDQLNREFEKELYWTGSQSHMIAGVKAQYEKLKESKLFINVRVRRKV